ncbi:MAG: SDR family oxidoreductase, partial [Acidobacteriia bacterium]|nr:SDR family oxidoreductase [Terriglobia bacterium]
DPAAVNAVIKDIAGVCLANANAPRQSVISGTPAAVKLAVAQFTAQGTTARMIPVACAFHSPLVAPAQQRLAQFLSAAPMAKPSFSVYSNTTAAPYPEDPTACKELLSQHLVRPVEFVREIEAMYAAGARVFVEVGPRGVLTGLAGEILGDRPKLAVASNQGSRPGLPQFLHLLGQLAAHGYALKLDRLYQDRSDRVLDLAALPTGQKQLPPSVWLVNGARAKPLKEEMPAQQKARKEEVPIQSSRPPYINGAASAAPAPVPSLVPEPPAPSLPASTPIPNGAFALEGIPEVMAQFQQTMARFLDAQKTIMLAYLGSESTVGQALTPANSIAVPQPVFISPPSPVPGHQSPVTAEAAVPIPQPLVPDPRPLIPEPQSHAPETGPTKDQLRSQLLAIVSDRTGYPAEMLNLDLDLEADLGIDSIKRVEILGTLQQSFTSAGISFEEGMMEKLSGVRTLQAIIDRVWEQISVDPQPPAPSAASGPTRQQLLSQLVAIVSDRTGYPPEMLDLNLDLEADLGIDSIKRVEILGTFQQTVATAGISLPEGVVETLTNIRTLQGILDRIFEQMSSTPDVVPTREHSDLSRDHSHPSRDREGAVPAASDTNAIQRFTLTAVPAPLAAGPSRIAKHRPVLIIGDHPAARELCSELLRHGFQVARVSHGESVQEMEPASYAADLASPESVANLMALIARRQGPPSGIVHLLALDGEADFAAHDHSSWQKQLQFGVKSLFHVAKTAGKHLHEAAREGGASLIAATGMGGAFLAPLPANTVAHFPGHGAIAGLVKTLALEWPEVYVKAVDINPGDSAEALARHLFEELHADDKLVEIGYNGHGRVTLEPVLAPFHAHVHAPETLDSSSVVLITGGARGITARAAQRIAELYRPILILAGRSSLPAAQEAPESAGITNPKELKAALMEQMRARGETPTPVSVERAYT